VKEGKQMKTNKILFFLLIAALSIFMIGCEKDEDNKVNEFEVLSSYIEDNGLDWINDMAGWVFPEDPTKYDDYLILDLRAADAFNATPNPIPGAINTSLAGMFDVVEANAKTNATKIWVTCYSGQTASFAHMLLRLKGYEAYLMKWGMSKHSAGNDKWSAQAKSDFVGHQDWVYNASPALPTFDFPVLDTGFEDAEDILDARIDVAIAAWPTLIAGTEVMNNMDAYNVLNYWKVEHYTGYGHFDGAYQLTPKTLTTDGNLNVFDPDGTNIFYCYTGQTAAAACAYLTVLGYDVKSVKYGVNNLIYDNLTDGAGYKWYGDPQYIN
jgi:rhodanese-related sulfurtransferase